MDEFARTGNGKTFLANVGSISRSLEVIAKNLDKPQLAPKYHQETIEKSRAAKLKMADEVIKDLNKMGDGEEDKQLYDLCFSAIAVIESLKEELK